MRFGFFGGMANNMYVFAKALNKLGKNVSFIRDRFDNYAISQPIWEDEELIFSYEQLIDSSNWSKNRWDEIESNFNWSCKIKMYDLEYNDKSLSNKLAFKNLIPNNFNIELIVDHLNKNDINLVCGMIPSLIAFNSNKPYFIMPHGSDIRLALGFSKSKKASILKRIIPSKLELGLKKSFLRSKCIITHGPSRLLANINRTQEEKYINKKIIFKNLGIPMKNYNISSKRISNYIKKKFNICVKEEYLVLVPSRIDFKVKGHDKLINVIRNLNMKDKFHFIFFGWGNDYILTNNLLKDNKSVTILNSVVSKKILYKLISLSDLIIDQFNLGHFGTITQESMAQKKPVMAFIHENDYSLINESPPPIINCKDEKDIFKSFKKIMNNEINLKEVGYECYKWIEERHNSKIVFKEFEKIIEEIL